MPTQISETSGSSAPSEDAGFWTEQIIHSHFLERSDNMEFLLNTPLQTLCEGADKIRRHYCGSSFSFCSIINGKSGGCSEDCRFCAQSSHYSSDTETYPFISPSRIQKDAEYHDRAGIQRYSIVTAGRLLKGEDLTKALEAFRYISQKSRIGLCASFGLLSEEDFHQLKKNGVTRYHANIETSRRYFPDICSTHTYEDKCKTIRLAQKAGLEVCSGGIIGMGETWEDRIDMAVSLHELNVVSIPVNILQPIAGTPFENLPQLSENDILRTIAIFRYLNPTAEIRLAAGRIHMKDSGKQAFLAGANAAITGDMLTTCGNSISQDINMIKELGFQSRKGEKS